MKNLLNVKTIFRIAGIIAITALIGIALVSCDLLAGLIPNDLFGDPNDLFGESYGNVTVNNETDSEIEVSLIEAGTGNPLGAETILPHENYTFSEVEAETSLIIIVVIPGKVPPYPSTTFEVLKNGNKSFRFTGSAVVQSY